MEIPSNWNLEYPPSQKKTVKQNLHVEPTKQADNVGQKKITMPN